MKSFAAIGRESFDEAIELCDRQMQGWRQLLQQIASRIERDLRQCEAIEA